MVQLYFGLPGCGKSTLMAYHAVQAVNSKKYKYVFCNVPLKIEGVIYLDNNFCEGKYEIREGLLLIDEASLYAYSRNFKSFSQEKLAFFRKHRHKYLDINLYTQGFNDMDKSIRTITDRVFYLWKPFITGLFITKCVRIPYGVSFPKDDNGNSLGEIVEGYSAPTPLSKLFCQRLIRPRWYKYFNSFENEYLKPLPQLKNDIEYMEQFTEYVEEAKKRICIDFNEFNVYVENKS